MEENKIRIELVAKNYKEEDARNIYPYDGSKIRVSGKKALVITDMFGSAIVTVHWWGCNDSDIIDTDIGSDYKEIPNCCYAVSFEIMKLADQQTMDIFYFSFELI